MTFRPHRAHKPYESKTMHTPEKQPGFLPKHGDYRDLLSYHKVEVIYDNTIRFCQRFLTRGDRTIDQMIQAARSGKQNIAKGCRGSVSPRSFLATTCSPSSGPAFRAGSTTCRTT